MMERMFTDRTRKQIKNKFHREERQNPERLEEALNSQRKNKFQFAEGKAGIPKASPVDANNERILAEKELRSARNDRIDDFMNGESTEKVVACRYL